MVVCTATDSLATPRISATLAWVLVGDWVDTHTSPPSLLGSTVQLSGSMGAWARYGTRYTASILRFAWARAFLASPSRRALAPSAAASRRVFSMLSLDRPAAAPGDHL